MAAKVIRRLTRELCRIQKSSQKDYSVEPKENDMFNWNLCIVGPQGSPYQNGLYLFDVSFPAGYPINPPKITMKTKIYHPKINEHGNIHLDVLIGDRWSPVVSASNLFIRIIELLRKPFRFGDCQCGNCVSKWNKEAAINYHKNRKQFIEIAGEYNEKYGNGDPVDFESVDILYMLAPLTINALNKCYQIIDNTLMDIFGEDMVNVVILYYGQKENEIKFCVDYDAFISRNKAKEEEEREKANRERSRRYDYRYRKLRRYDYKNEHGANYIGLASRFRYNPYRRPLDLSPIQMDLPPIVQRNE